MRVKGPLLVTQLLETTLLNLVNFPSLIATNARRMRFAAGPGKILLEFGLRRAQGPDGAMSASKYSYLGGFDGTSNVLAGKLFGLPIGGTHAHAYVMSYSSLEGIKARSLKGKDGEVVDFVDLVVQKKSFFCEDKTHNFCDVVPGAERANTGELAAYISYAMAFPNNFQALLDTYDVLTSGVPNFIFVCSALIELGYVPYGVRLDSGDLGELSKETRRIFRETDRILEEKDPSKVRVKFATFKIVASNDINEKTLWDLRRDGHDIDSFGIGEVSLESRHLS